MEENQGGKEMITLSPEIEAAVQKILLQTDIGDSVEIDSDGLFVLVRTNSPEFQKLKEQNSLMFPVKGNDQFLICTKVQK
jgi:hypothetical protein